MPKIPIDYQNTIIYKIEHIEKEDLIYVGHTRRIGIDVNILTNIGF